MMTFKVLHATSMNWVNIGGGVSLKLFGSNDG